MWVHEKQAHKRWESLGAKLQLPPITLPSILEGPTPRAPAPTSPPPPPPTKKLPPPRWKGKKYSSEEEEDVNEYEEVLEEGTLETEVDDEEEEEEDGNEYVEVLDGGRLDVEGMFIIFYYFIIYVSFLISGPARLFFNYPRGGARLFFDHNFEVKYITENLVWLAIHIQKIKVGQKPVT
jgi:hypothetical protein